MKNHNITKFSDYIRYFTVIVVSGISYLGYKYFVKTKKPSVDDLTKFLLADFEELDKNSLDSSGKIRKSLLDDSKELDKILLDSLEKIKKSLLDDLREPTENSLNEGYTRFERIIKYLELTDEAFKKGITKRNDVDSISADLQKPLRVFLYIEAVVETLQKSKKPREKTILRCLNISGIQRQMLKDLITNRLETLDQLSPIVSISIITQVLKVFTYKIDVLETLKASNDLIEKNISECLQSSSIVHDALENMIIKKLQNIDEEPDVSTVIEILKKRYSELLYKNVIQKLINSKDPEKNKMFIWLRLSSTARHILKNIINKYKQGVIEVKYTFEEATDFMILTLQNLYNEYMSWVKTSVALALGTAAIAFGVGMKVGFKISAKRQTQIPTHELSKTLNQNYSSTIPSFKKTGFKRIR